MRKWTQWLPLLALIVANESPAPVNLTISNTNGGANNFYAPNLATALNFSNVTLSADNDITVTEDIILSHGANGLTTGRLILNSLNNKHINGDVTMGTGGVTLNGNTVNLRGAFYSHTGTALAGALLAGNAQTVNLLDNAALIQQAIAVSASTASTVIDAPFGTSTALLVNKDLTINLSGGLVSGTVDFTNALALMNLSGYAFELDQGSGYAPVGSGPVTATSGSLRGFLYTDHAPFEFDFTQLAPQINLTEIPEPSTVALTLLGVISLACRPRSRPRTANRS